MEATEKQQQDNLKQNAPMKWKGRQKQVAAFHEHSSGPFPIPRITLQLPFCHGRHGVDPQTWSCKWDTEPTGRPKLLKRGVNAIGSRSPPKDLSLPKDGSEMAMEGNAMGSRDQN